MKKILLFTIPLILFASLPGMSVAKKKYRYIKREHGLKVLGGIPTATIPISTETSSTEAIIYLDTSYQYNWKGLLEFGPYIFLSYDLLPSFSTNDYGVGVLGEYNIIKNRGKRKLIPSVGITLGIDKHKEGSDNNIGGSAGVYGVLKWFVDKRTPFVVKLSYRLVTPFNGFFTSFAHKPSFTFGFSHYFDFY